MSSLSSEDQGELSDWVGPRSAAIVVAAGTGQRFGGLKQFEALTDGERLVDRAVRTAAATCAFVVLVLPADTPWSGPPVDEIVEGGSTRLASVAAGLAVVPNRFEAVLVHDPSHALASTHLCRETLRGLLDPQIPEGSRPDGVVPVLATAEVIKRRLPDDRLETVGREGLGSAQAPMAFRRLALEQAHRSVEPPPHLRDDSELVELTGGAVIAIDGEPQNIHIVDRATLDMARRIARPVDLSLPVDL